MDDLRLGFRRAENPFGLSPGIARAAFSEIGSGFGNFEALLAA
jgi:hypothetical protein